MALFPEISIPEVVAPAPIIALPTEEFLSMRKAEFDANNVAGDEFFSDTGTILRHNGIDRGNTVYLSGNINEVANDIRAEIEVAYHVQPKPESTAQQVVHTVFSAFSVNPYYLAVGTSQLARQPK